MNQPTNPLEIILGMAIGLLLLAAYFRGIVIIIVFVYNRGGIFKNPFVLYIVGMLAMVTIYIAFIVGLYDVIKSLVKFLFKKEVQKQEKTHATNYDFTYEKQKNSASNDITYKLIYIGLASIGRKTNTVNQYLTSEIDAKRRVIERPFWEMLARKFSDGEQIEMLAKNFMFFKETCLFLIYSILLKNHINLHSQIKSELQNILSDSIDIDNKSRIEYFYSFSKRFYDTFTKTKSMNESLRFAFWSTLAVKYPDWVTLEGIADILSNDCLFKIFKYSYEAVGAAYKESKL